MTVDVERSIPGAAIGCGRAQPRTAAAEGNKRAGPALQGGRGCGAGREPEGAWLEADSAGVGAGRNLEGRGRRRGQGREGVAKAFQKWSLTREWAWSEAWPERGGRGAEGSFRSGV